MAGELAPSCGPDMQLQRPLYRIESQRAHFWNNSERKRVGPQEEKTEMQRLLVPVMSLVLFSGMSFASSAKHDSHSGHKKPQFIIHSRKALLALHGLNFST